MIYYEILYLLSAYSAFVIVNEHPSEVMLLKYLWLMKKTIISWYYSIEKNSENEVRVKIRVKSSCPTVYIGEKGFWEIF